MNKVENHLQEWSERKIDGKKFNEIFQIDGTPIWYFLEPLMKLAYLPRPFKSLAEIEENVKSNRGPTWFENLKLDLTCLGLRKGLLINERIKRYISKSRRKKVKEKDVLFLGYTNEIVQEKGKLRPIGFGNVVDVLKERGIKPLVLICDPLSKNSLRGLLKFQNLLYSYVDPEIIKESKRLSHALNRKWKKINERKKGELFAFDGKSYWKFLKNELNFLFSKEMLFTLITYYLTFKKIVESHRIHVIYLTSSGGFYESLLLGVAYKLNKKVVYSPHGYGGRYFIVHREFLENVYFAAWGNEEKEKLLKLGIKNKNIFVTGSPFFDEIVKYRKESKRPKKTVTLITQPLVEDKYVGEEEYFNYIRKFLIQINNMKNVTQVIVKLHPREKYKSRYESIVKSLELKNVRVTQEMGKDVLYSILSSSDLLISTGSTTDIEGLMLGKNVIVIDGLKRGSLAELGKKDKYRKAVVVIDKDNDIAGTATKVLTDKDLQREIGRKKRRYLENSFYKIDGKAHERVADLISRLIDKNSIS